MENDANKKSKIWAHFKPIEKNDQGKSNTECKTDGCNEKLVYHNTTSSMIKHVKWKHLRNAQDLRINEREYPILSMISKYLLSAPVMSMASERIFLNRSHS